MVKSNSRRGHAPSREEVDQLATQFGSRVDLSRESIDQFATQSGNSVDLHDDGGRTTLSEATATGCRAPETCTSIPLRIPPGREPDADAQAQARFLSKKSSVTAYLDEALAFLDNAGEVDMGPRAVAFDVDLTGSQSAETPFLRPILSTGQPSQPPAWCELKTKLHLGPRRVMRYGIFKRATRLMVTARMKADLAIGRSDGVTPTKIVANLEALFPQSVQEIMNRDPSGQGRVKAPLVRCWLAEHPEVASLMKLTPRKLEAIFSDEVDDMDIVMQSLKIE